MAKEVDITAEVCPLTWVYVKLALESAGPGEVVEVRLRGEEPARSIPRNALEEGHEVVSCGELTDGVRVLLLRARRAGAVSRE